LANATSVDESKVKKAECSTVTGKKFDVDLKKKNDKK